VLGLVFLCASQAGADVHDADKTNAAAADDLSFRGAAWAAVLKGAADTANQEGRLAVATLKRRAVNIGRAQGTQAAKFQSTRATNAAFAATTALVGRRARHYCRSISTLRRLPPMCEAEGKALFSALKTKGKVLVWRNQAQDAAALAASKAAALAGFQAAAANAYSVMHPLAKRIAAREFNRLWSIYQGRWKRKEADHKVRLRRNKVLFFKQATQTIIAHAQAAVKKQIFAKLRAQAGTRMRYAARVAASRVARKTVARSLAPRFVRASAKALPIAIRVASKKALKMWTPSWKPGTPWRRHFDFNKRRHRAESVPSLPGGEKLSGHNKIPRGAGPGKGSRVRGNTASAPTLPGGKKLRGKAKVPGAGTKLSSQRRQTLPDGKELFGSDKVPTL